LADPENPLLRASIWAKNQDQLWNPTLCNLVWATFTFLPLATLVQPFDHNKLYGCCYKKNVISLCHSKQFFVLLFFADNLIADYSRGKFLQVNARQRNVWT